MDELDDSRFVGHSLVELVSAIVDNRGRTCPTDESGFPLIATNCIKADGRLPVFENVRYVSDETKNRWFRAHPEPNDIVFVCKGSPGRVAMVPDPVPFAIAQDMVALRANRKLVDPYYLFYLLKTPSTQREIVNLHVGTMIPHFKKGDFGKLHLRVHRDLSEQRRIAGVLGALDDLIDTNKRLIASLANMRAAAWSSVTPIATTTLGSVAVLCADRATPSELSGDTVYLGLEHFAEAGAGLVSRGRAHGLDSQKSRFQRGDVLYGKLRPYFRKVARPDFDGICSTEIWVLRPSTDVTAEYLESVVSSQPFTDHAMRGSGGTHMPRARWDHVSGFPIAIPNAAEMEKVTRITEPMWRLMWSLDAENETLSGVRDELLPLLLSGAISVAEITP